MRRKKKYIYEKLKKKESIFSFLATTPKKKENSMFLYAFLRRIILRGIKKKKKVIHLRNMKYFKKFHFRKTINYQYLPFPFFIFDTYSNKISRYPRYSNEK
jgi:hypothetical protein